ncbi:MAG: Uma2 family endonuclease [Pseudanabaenaceae cyanobacterium]
MTVAHPKMTLEEFLQFEDGTEYRYELENGELIQMAAESEINMRIVMLLVATFLQMGIPFYRLRIGSEIMVNSQMVGVRVPDLVVFSEELAEALKGASRSLITFDLPAPMLIVEVVSPNQEKRDYHYKRSEYSARGIPEYWIIDPMQGKVPILEWVEGMYKERVFAGEERLVSPQLGNLSLTAQFLLSAGAIP